MVKYRSEEDSRKNCFAMEYSSISGSWSGIAIIIFSNIHSNSSNNNNNDNNTNSTPTNSWPTAKSPSRAWIVEASPWQCCASNPRVQCGDSSLFHPLPVNTSGRLTTPNPPTNNVDFRGFDSSIILIYRGGIPRSRGDFPESLTQAMLVGCNVSREIGRSTARSGSPAFGGRPPRTEARKPSGAGQKWLRRPYLRWFIMSIIIIIKSNMCICIYIYIYIYLFIYLFKAWQEDWPCQTRVSPRTRCTPTAPEHENLNQPQGVCWRCYAHSESEHINLEIWPRS